MLELRRTEPVDIDMRIFFSDVVKQFQIPLEPELRMMPALHQDLHPAGRRQLIELLVNLLVRQDVMVLVLFRPVKSAELAIDVADVRVVDVPVDDVSHHFASLAVVTFLLREVASRIRERAEAGERPAV